MTLTLPFALLIAATAAPAAPQTNDEAAVLAVVDAYLDALARRDGAALRAQARDDALITTLREEPDGRKQVVKRSWDAFATGIETGQGAFREAMPDNHVRIDGDMAAVWGVHTVTIDGQLRFCGINNFSMIREAGRWQVQYATWTSRSVCTG